MLNQISESDILLDSSMTPEQKDMLLALLDPLGDDEGVDLIGQELPEPENTFTGLSEVKGFEEGGGLGCYLASEWNWFGAKCARVDTPLCLQVAAASFISLKPAQADRDCAP